MSYCVNCGVELARTEKKCPLCGVEVINPAELPEIEEARAFPRRQELQSAFDRDLWIKLVSVILAVPAIICLVANLLVPSPVFWSLYVIGALVVGWTFCVSPFLFKKYFPLLWIVANTLATSGYLLLIESLSPDSRGWFLPLALPIVLGIAVLSLAVIVLIQRGVLKELFTVAGIFGAIGLLTVLVEASISLYLRQSFHLQWSWYSLISCAAMAVVLVIIEQKLIVKEKLKRRLHF